MKIGNITLNHYRGAHDLKIVFDKKLNVFTGVNGAGKSTVLDAIAIMLSWAVNRIRTTSASGRPITENDVTNGKSYSSIDIQAYSNQESISWRLVKYRSGHLQDDKSSLVELNEFVRKMQEKIVSSNERCNLPLFVYYPVNRSVLDIPLRIKARHNFKLLTAYDEGLTRGADFRTFFEWFREREDLENESRKYSGSRQGGIFDSASSEFIDVEYPDRQLEAVRNALEKFLPEFKNISIRRQPLRMEVEKMGKRLNINQLSDGEKCLIAMIGDLARRLAIANPLQSNPLQGEGIVLIDEIDLHLHPKWQRMVVPRLLQVFLECQFFISTHSPHVISHILPENLFLLSDSNKGIVAASAQESYGKNTDRVLEDLMDTPSRPDIIQDDMKEIFLKIQVGAYRTAKELIENVRQKIGDDPELLKAEVLIKRMETIGK